MKMSVEMDAASPNFLKMPRLVLTAAFAVMEFVIVHFYLVVKNVISAGKIAAVLHQTVNRKFYLYD